MSEKSVLKLKLTVLEQQEEQKKKLVKDFVYTYLYQINKIIRSIDDECMYLKLVTIEKHIHSFNTKHKTNLFSDSVKDCLINHFFWSYDGDSLYSTSVDFDNIRKGK